MGAEQYGDLTYLDRSFPAHIAEIQDELIDVANYAFMLWHKFNKMQKKMPGPVNPLNPLAPSALLPDYSLNDETPI